MNKFDWVVWYYIGLQTLGFICALLLDGTPKEGFNTMRSWTIGFLIFLPVTGRMLGWW